MGNRFGSREFRGGRIRLTRYAARQAMFIRYDLSANLSSTELDRAGLTRASQRAGV